VWWQAVEAGGLTIFVSFWFLGFALRCFHDLTKEIIMKSLFRAAMLALCFSGVALLPGCSSSHDKAEGSGREDNPVVVFVRQSSTGVVLESGMAYTSDYRPLWDGDGFRFKDLCRGNQKVWLPQDTAVYFLDHHPSCDQLPQPVLKLNF
jgi:hypothetical protein